MGRIIIFCCLILCGFTLCSQSSAGKKHTRFQNDQCFSDTTQREIFKKIQVTPLLTETSLSQLKNRLQEAMDALQVFSEGKVVLIISVVFFTGGTHCIYRLETDRTNIDETRILTLFENQSLFSHFIPGKQSGVARDAEGSIELQLK